MCIFQSIYAHVSHISVFISEIWSSHHHHQRRHLTISSWASRQVGNQCKSRCKYFETKKYFETNHIKLLLNSYFMRWFFHADIFPTEIFSLCVVNFMIPLKIEREFECNVTRLIALPFTSSNRLKVLIDCHWAAFNSNENWLHFECDRMCGLVMS